MKTVTEEFLDMARELKSREDKATGEEEKERLGHFKNALSNYAPVLNDEFEHKLREADEGLEFPESPEGVLDYLGNIGPLEMDERVEAIVRKWTKKLVDEKGPQYVWDNRIRLKLELRFIVHDMGL